MSPVVTMKALLESGVHFGHRTNKWNPKMRQYIFTERNGIHIIDLQQTVKLLDEAYDFIRDKVAEGGTVLFVGTKRQAQDTIAEQAVRCGMPYVNERWLGGTITNWFTIQKRIFELERLERMRDSGEINLLTKKEGLMIEREIERLEGRLSGIRSMKRLPDILFVVDINREDTAVHEANLKEIPVIAMVDTNCDPKNIDYIIPSNDDAIRAIKLLVGKVADAVMEGKAIRDKEAEEEEMVEQTMPVEVSRFTDDEELEDEALLGESTLKHLGSSRKGKKVHLEDEEDEEAFLEEQQGGEDEVETPEEEAEEVAEAEAEDEADAEEEEEAEAESEEAEEAEAEAELEDKAESEEAETEEVESDEVESDEVETEEVETEAEVGDEAEVEEAEAKEEADAEDEDETEADDEEAEEE
jgi:small subunit ribosomal protein S2